MFENLNLERIKDKSNYIPMLRTSETFIPQSAGDCRTLLHILNNSSFDFL